MSSTQVEPVEPAEQERRGDVVGQVGDDPHRSGPCATRAGSTVECIGLDAARGGPPPRLPARADARRSAGRARRRRPGAAPASSSARVSPPGPGPTSTTVAARGRLRRQRSGAGSTGSNRKCWPSRLSARGPGGSCRLSCRPRPAASEPDVDEGVPAQVAQIAAGLPLDLLLLEPLPDRCRGRSVPPAAACAGRGPGRCVRPPG